MEDGTGASGAERDEVATGRDAKAGARDKSAAERDGRASDVADDARRREGAIRERLEAREDLAAAPADAYWVDHRFRDAQEAPQQLEIDGEVQRSEAEWARHELVAALDRAEGKRADAVGHRGAGSADRAAAGGDRLAAEDDRRVAAADRDQAEIDAQVRR